MTARSRSPAQIFSLVLGIALVAVGIAGFFWSASFATGIGAGVEQGFVLGVLAVNGWHNVVHLVTGLVGLAAASSYAAARTYALVVGVAYAVITVLGFTATENDALAGLLAINTEDNVLHLLIAVSAIAAWLTTSARPAARPANA